MAYRAAVVGASGYTGAELLRLVAGHPELEVAHVTADSNAGAAVAALYPSLGAEYPALEYAAFDPADISGLDLAFLALPHGESQRIVPELLGKVDHVVDLGADFRLPAGNYEEWYGGAHGAPELLDRFAFGLPELFRADLGSAEHTAAPGCYPTAAILALAPLLAEGLVDPAGMVVDALSGVSGRGRGLSAPSLFSEANENASPYGLLTHRHTGEMEMALARVSASEPRILFTPHLVPMTRGVLATCHARATATGLTTPSLLQRYREFYAGEPFVRVLDEAPATKATLGGNAAHLTVRFDERTDSVLALGAIDNLVKGASGQALQCANVLLGLPETTGLSAIGLAP
jgi:N-acetyl-gamma-glutamyl-phosphate reductase